MPEVYDYATIRVVPRIVRGEFVNVGVIVACPTQEFLGCRIAESLGRVSALDPSVDLGAVARHLETLREVCLGAADGGPIAKMPARERFHWLTHPRSTIVQTSPIHSGTTGDPASALERLFSELVDAPS